MYAVCVTFQLHSGQEDGFLPLMLENARVSLIDEAGCHQFDVLSNAGAPGTVFLYELYEDRAAFDAHLDSAHFQAFDEAVTSMIADKQISTWDTVTQ